MLEYLFHADNQLVHHPFKNKKIPLGVIKGWICFAPKIFSSNEIICFQPIVEMNEASKLYIRAIVNPNHRGHGESSFWFQKKGETSMIEDVPYKESRWYQSSTILKFLFIGDKDPNWYISKG